MNCIKEECLRYSLVCGVKSEFKDAEAENVNLKEKLCKLQKDCLLLNSRLVSTNWKIQQANFILGCEKKKQDALYDIIKTAEAKYATEEVQLTEGKKLSDLFDSKN